MTRNFMKNCRVLRELFRIRFQRLMMFRLGFFGPFFVDGSLFVVQLIVFHAVYDNVERIGTWGRGEMILYIGTFSLLNAVSMVLCFFGVSGIPQKIQSGELDLYLTKPVSPLLRLTFEAVNPGSIPLVIFSLCIIGYGVHTAGIRPDLKNVLSYSVWVCVMVILYYDMEVIIRCMPFYVMSNAKLIQLEEASLDLAMKLPGIAFYGIYKVIFYCILPYGIMATFPVQSMAGEMTREQALFGITAVCIFSGLTAFLWKTGLKRYNSASS